MKGDGSSVMKEIGELTYLSIYEEMEYASNQYLVNSYKIPMETMLKIREIEGIHNKHGDD